MCTLQSIMRADRLEKMRVAKIVARSIGGVGLLALVAAGVGCDAPNPQGPSGVAAGQATIGATTTPVATRSANVDAPAEPNRANRASAVDATTLKADPPVVQSPKDGSETESVRVTLIIRNARPKFLPTAPFRYRFELHEGDAGAGASIETVLVDQGTGDTTRHAVGRALRQGRRHSWRVRAEIDTRSGPWSAWASFRTPILKQLAPPTLESPINGATITNLREPLSVSNGAVLRPDGRVIYEFEVDDDSAFSSPLRTRANRTGGPEAGGRTIGRLAQNLAPGKTYHWRVRARDDTDTGRWSDVQTFKVAERPQVADRPRGGRADEIDASSVRYLHRNIADWPITSTVTSITISGHEICVRHTGAGRFPRSQYGTPPDDITIEGNVWVFGEFGGRWHGATWDWLRVGQECKAESTDSLGPEQIRIPPMDRTWRPRSGEKLCFAMSARARDSVQAGRVRSNIACVNVP